MSSQPVNLSRIRHLYPEMKPGEEAFELSEIEVTQSSSDLLGRNLFKYGKKSFEDESGNKVYRDRVYSVVHIFADSEGELYLQHTLTKNGEDLLTRHFGKLGLAEKEEDEDGYKILNPTILIKGHRLFNVFKTTKARCYAPVQELRYTPEEKARVDQERELKAHRRMARKEQMQEAGLGEHNTDAPTLAGLGQLAKAPLNIPKAVKRGIKAHRLGHREGVKDSALSVFAHVLGFAAGGCSATPLVGKVLVYLVPSITLPGAFATVALCGTIFGLVVAAVAVAWQVRKLYHQVTFCNSPHMRLARFLEENSPAELEKNLERLIRLRAIIESIMEKKIDLDNKSMIPGLFGLLTVLDPVVVYRKQIAEGNMKVGDEPQPRTDLQDIHTKALVFLANSFKEEYENNIEDLQERGGENLANELDGGRLAILAQNADATEKGLLAAQQITESFAILNKKAHRKMLIHGFGIAIAVVAIVSLGLFFASGIGLPVTVGLFAGVCVLGLIHSRISKNFNTKAFPNIRLSLESEPTPPPLPSFLSRFLNLLPHRLGVGVHPHPHHQA